MSKPIYLANITVKIKNRYDSKEKTYEKVSYIESDNTLYKGNQIVKVEKLGILGKTNY